MLKDILYTLYILGCVDQVHPKQPVNVMQRAMDADKEWHQFVDSPEVAEVISKVTTGNKSISD